MNIFWRVVLVGKSMSTKTLYLTAKASPHFTMEVITLGIFVVYLVREGLIRLIEVALHMKELNKQSAFN